MNSKTHFSLIPPPAPISIKWMSCWLIISSIIAILSSYLAFTKNTYQGNILSDMMNGIHVYGQEWYFPTALYSCLVLIEGIGIRYLKRWAWLFLILDVGYTLYIHISEIVSGDSLGFLLNIPDLLIYILAYFVYKHRKLFS